MIRRRSLGIPAALLLTVALAAPAAGGALVERTSGTLPLDCTIDQEHDPETGEPTHFFEFCVEGTAEFDTVTAPSGVVVSSGVVSSTLTVRLNGELLLNSESQTNRFRNVARDGFEQVSRLHFTRTVTNHLSGDTFNCSVEFHLANGQVRWGSQDIVCEGDTGGGGEG